MQLQRWYKLFSILFHNTYMRFILTFFIVSVFLFSGDISLADVDPIELKEPILKGDTTIEISERDSIGILQQYTQMIFKFMAGLILLLAVLFIMGSGIMLMTSQDSAGKENAKNNIIQVLSGVALLFLSGLILHTINPNFFIF